MEILPKPRYVSAEMGFKALDSPVLIFHQSSEGVASHDELSACLLRHYLTGRLFHRLFTPDHLPAQHTNSSRSDLEVKESK